MEAILEPLIESPKLALYIEKLQAILEHERLKRVEFYNQISESDKAEFIHGKAIFHSPAKKKHMNVSENLSLLLGIHVRIHDLGRIYYEKAMIELTRNSYEPDICFFTKKRDETFEEDQMLFPAPDFVVEILSKSTEKRDRGVKFEDYAQHGVKEYWIIDPSHKSIEQYLLRHDKFELIFKAQDGLIESKIIKGFSMPVKAIFSLKENQKMLQNLLGK